MMSQSTQLDHPAHDKSTASDMHSPVLKTPMELLELIANQTGPSDLVNLALSCRKVYSAANKALALHHNRKTLYTIVNIRIFTGMTQVAHPVDLLQKIRQDERIAVYPRTLQISYQDNSQLTQGPRFAKSALEW